MIGFDYTARISPASLKAAGCSVVIRYTTWSGWPKSLTPAEADELHAAGIPIAANFESTADRMLGGYAAGHADAIEARGHLGDDHMPTGLKVWFSADWDVQPGQVATVLGYMQGAADALGSKDLTGLYGGLRACRAAADAGYAIWQTVAWSGGVWDPRAVARQTGEQRYIDGVQVDVNEIINLAGLGAWGGPTSGGTVPVIPPSIGQFWPDIANGFPANSQYDTDTAIIWADAGARAAALYAHQARDAVNALAQRPAPSIDVNALAAAVAAQIHVPAPPAPSIDVAALAQALAPLVTAGATADAIAAAVAAHLQITVGSK